MLCNVTESLLYTVQIQIIQKTKQTKTKPERYLQQKNFFLHSGKTKQNKHHTGELGNITSPRVVDDRRIVSMERKLPPCKVTLCFQWHWVVSYRETTVWILTKYSFKFSSFDPLSLQIKTTHKGYCIAQPQPDPLRHMQKTKLKAETKF